MLTEITQVQQRPGEPRRRWFQSNEQDLIVWLAEDGRIVGFQLCYDRRLTERAITWLWDRGYAHHKVDDGEEQPVNFKRTPILLHDDFFDSQAVLDQFQHEAAESAPSEIQEFVTEKLRAYP